MGIPPTRIGEAISPAKVFVVGVAGVLPALLLLAARIPGWVKAWIWLPLIAVPAVIVFGRLGNRPLYEVLRSALLFYMRRGRARRVWRAAADAGMPRVLAHLQASPSRYPQESTAWGIAVAVLTVALIGVILLAWYMEMAQVVSAEPAAVSTGSDALPALATHPPATPLLLIPTLTATPVPIPEHEVWEVHTWGVQDSGYLVIGAPRTVDCEVLCSLSGTNWRTVVRLPETGVNGLMVRSLLGAGLLTIESPCAVQVEFIPYQPHLYHSTTWFVPVCSPPGRVMVGLHGSAAHSRLRILEENQPDVLLASTRFTSVPVGQNYCWTYWIEGSAPLFPEIIVMAEGE